MVKHKIENPRFDAEILLTHVLKTNKVELYLYPDLVLTSEQFEVFLMFTERRLNNEPVAYITGHKEFYGLDFEITASVLIPRPETEILVEHTIDALNSYHDSDFTIVDVGTGCGNIAISLAKHVPHIRIMATEISEAALNVAVRNSYKHGIADRVSFLPGNLLQPLSQPVHCIVANLPYIRTEEIQNLMPEVSFYEPRVALDGGENGLLYTDELLKQARSKLLNSGVTLIEIGHDQANAVKKLVEQYFPRAYTEVFSDLNGLDRVVKVIT